jgi:hypothetical protein
MDFIRIQLMRAALLQRFFLNGICSVLETAIFLFSSENLTKSVKQASM